MTVPATPKQHDFIAGLAAAKSIDPAAATALFDAASSESFNKKEAREVIDNLMAEDDRAIPEGIHAAPTGPWKGQRIEVKRSKRGRLYAVLVEGSEYLNGKGLFGLDASTLVEEAAEAVEVPEGIHLNPEGAFRKVVRSRSGNLYAMGLNEDGRFKDYLGKAGLAGLSADTVLDAEQAAAFGHQYGRCVFCGRTLTDDGENKSLDVGYGPQCAKNNDLPWG